MNKHLGLTLICCLALGSFLAGQGRGATVSVSGVVKDQDGKPIAGVSIGIRDINAHKGTSVTAVSAEDGSFKLSGEYTSYKSPNPKFASVVMEKLMAKSVLVTSDKKGYMPVRVLAKDSAAGVQLTMYPAIAGKVTLVGNLLATAHLQGMTKAAMEDPEQHVYLLAFDGTPGIKAEFAQILKDFWPDDINLDGDSALELENQLAERLLFNLDGPQQKAMWAKVKAHPYDGAASVTGEVHEKDAPPGQVWISTSACESTTFKYPDKVMSPTKPLVMPDKNKAVEVKLNDKVSIRFIYVPPGRFYMGCPLIQIPHWQESPQHMVTLTKGFYMAETPLTYEQYGLITGDTAAGDSKNYDAKLGKYFKLSRTKEDQNMDPQSAAGLSCQMFSDFCKKFKDKTGKAVRLPTNSEWEYAARCGVSNPCCSPNGSKREFPTNPPAENDPFAPVKNTQPNVWGFYQMIVFGSSERTSDSQGFHATSKGDLVDPSGPVKADSADPVGKHEPNDHAAAGNPEYPIMELLRTGGTRGYPFEGEWNNFAKRQRLVLVEDAE